MHHPGRKPGAMPRLIRRIVPGFVNRFLCYSFSVPHRSNSSVDQLSADSLPPEVFRNVYGVDYAYTARLDDGRNRFPVVDASNEETSNDSMGFRHQPEAIYLSESGVKPLFHGGLGIGSEVHVGTCDILKVSEPGSLNLWQIFTIPVAYVYFHCEFQSKLR